MSDPYKHIRGILGTGSHMETAAGSGAGLISLDEAKRMGVDVSGLLESGTTDTSDPSVEDPKNQHTHVGVRMPGAAKPPVDVRPQTGYKDGQLVGLVTATIKPVYGSQKKGSLPEYELVWVGQRIYPDGLKQSFGSESEAKKFASGGETVKWFRPANPDPWESLSRSPRLYTKAVQALVEGDKGKFEKCVRGVKAQNKDEGKPEEGTDGDNPWAICHASTDEALLNEIALEQSFEEWMAETDRLFKEKTGNDWANLAGDEEPVRRAYEEGEEPLNFVLRIMEKYDLDDVSGAWGF